MTFKNASTLSAVLTLILAISYLFAGGVMVERWQIEPTDSVLLLGRRIGASFLGLSVLFFLARSIPLSSARRALSAAAVTTCSLLAFLGVCEFSAGRAAAPILASAAIEAVLAVLFARLLVSDHKLLSAAEKNGSEV
jgi:hypothetical protein